MTYLWQKSIMWWIYVSLLEDFNHTHFKLSQTITKIFKISLILATIGYTFIGVFAPIFNCKCQKIPGWEIIVPVGGIIDFILSVVLLSFYVSNLFKLLQSVKPYVEHNKQHGENKTSKSYWKNKQKIKLIVSVATRHTFCVALSIASTWMIVVMPILINVSIPIFFEKLFCNIQFMCFNL